MIKKIVLTLVALLLIGMVGYTFVDLRIKDNNEVPDNYIAVSSGGAGEIVFATYIYEKDNRTYEYISTVSTTKSYGSTEWVTKVKNKGKINSKEDLLEVEKKELASQFLLVADNKTYSVEELADILFE